MRCSPCLALALLSLTGPAGAAIVEMGPTDDLRAAVNALGPGDELVLRGGTYNLTSRFSIGAQGTAAAPIVIRSKDGETAVITRPDAGQNTINVENARHLVLRALEVRGGSHGIRIMNSSFVTIEGCEVHQTGDVGISANIGGNTYEGLVFRGNHIHHTGGTGEGMYLGCNDAACVMFDSVIEANWIHDTLGTSQGDGIEIKHGSYGNVVRDNVIHDTNYPCILVYGTAGQARNVLERNVMWGCGDHGIQAAADAVIRNNIVLGAGANGIHNQIHQGATPGNLEIVHNTVVVRNDALRTNDVAQAVVIANNALYSQNASALRVGGNTALVVSTGNVGRGAVQGVGGFDASGDVATDFVNATFGSTNLDVFPALGSKLIGAGDTARVVADDFDGTLRNGAAHVGAYHYVAGGTPAWPIGPGFKGSIPLGAGGAAGAAGAGGAGGTAAGGTGAGATGGAGGGAGGGAAGAAANGGSGVTAGGTGGSSGGTGGSTAGSAGSVSTGATAGAGTAASPSGDDGGCGCRAVTEGGGPASSGLAFLGLVLLLRRRARREGPSGLAVAGRRSFAFPTSRVR